MIKVKWPIVHCSVIQISASKFGISWRIRKKNPNRFRHTGIPVPVGTYSRDQSGLIYAKNEASISHVSVPSSFLWPQKRANIPKINHFFSSVASWQNLFLLSQRLAFTLMHFACDRPPNSRFNMILHLAVYWLASLTANAAILGSIPVLSTQWNLRGSRDKERKNTDKSAFHDFTAAASRYSAITTLIKFAELAPCEKS